MDEAASNKAMDRHSFDRRMAGVLIGHDEGISDPCEDEIAPPADWSDDARSIIADNSLGSWHILWSKVWSVMLPFKSARSAGANGSSPHKTNQRIQIVLPPIVQDSSMEQLSSLPSLVDLKISTYHTEEKLQLSPQQAAMVRKWRRLMPRVKSYPRASAFPSAVEIGTDSLMGVI